MGTLDSPLPLQEGAGDPGSGYNHMAKTGTRRQDEHMLPSLKNTTHLRPPEILTLLKTDHSWLGSVIPTRMWAVLENGCDPDGYAQQFPKTVDHATIAFGAAGYGCQPHATPRGVETYFSWIYDRLNIHLDLPAPLLMHTIAFPGTEWDQSQRHEHLSNKTDAYNIRYHPAVLNNAIDGWLHDARRMLPGNVRRIDAILLAHSYGGRALTAHLAEIGGSASVERAPLVDWQPILPTWRKGLGLTR